jgi:hypothetical protein
MKKRVRSQSQYRLLSRWVDRKPSICVGCDEHFDTVVPGYCGTKKGFFQGVGHGVTHLSSQHLAIEAGESRV